MSDITTVATTEEKPKREILTVTDITEAELEALPEKYSDLLNDFAADLSYEDMAIKYNIPKGTVRSRIHRAREAVLKIRERAKTAAPSPETV